MLSRFALLCCLLVAAPLPALSFASAVRAGGAGSAVEWTEAPLEDVLARARDEGRLVLVELVTEWELDCDRLRTSLEHETVVPALEGLLCVRVDAERGEGALFAFRHRIGTYPTLLFLEPDGSVRERLKGYQAPAAMARHLGRIERNEDTLAVLRGAVESEPGNLEARYAYALKLAKAGDAAGDAEQRAEIRRLDPEGTSPVSLRMNFDAIHDAFYQDLYDWKEPDWTALITATEQVDDPVLVFKGVSMQAYGHHIEGIRARLNESREDIDPPHLIQSRALYKQSWEIVPEASRALFANELAYNFWGDRKNLTDDERAFALEVADQALAARPDDASIMDTVACCRFMNGDVEGALELVERCRELDPSRPAQWDARVKLFTAEPEPAEVEPGESTGAADQPTDG